MGEFDEPKILNVKLSMILLIIVMLLSVWLFGGIFSVGDEPREMRKVYCQADLPRRVMEAERIVEVELLESKLSPAYACAMDFVVLEEIKLSTYNNADNISLVESKGYPYSDCPEMGKKYLLLIANDLRGNGYLDCGVSSLEGIERKPEILSLLNMK